MSESKRMEVLTTCLEAVGAATFTVGAGLAWLPAGFLTGGAVLVALGWLLAPEPPRRRR